MRRLFLAARGDLAGLPDAVIDLQVDAQQRDYAARFPGADERIVVLDGRPVGRLWVHRAGDHWRLLDIALLAAARGIGVGTRLLGDLIAAADRAAVPLRLTVDRENAAARRLYARLGFEDVAGAGPWVLMERPRPPAAAPPATG